MPHSTQQNDQSRLPLAQRYWNCNLPASQHTEHCPESLSNISDRNVQLLSGSQDAYSVTSWDECRQLVAENRINDFQRSPLALRKYLIYMYGLKQRYGSVLSFVQHERLHWDSTVAAGEPFSNEDDFTVLFNDWPYGIDERVTHLVVWTKFVLEDGEDGMLTAASRRLVDEFVARMFTVPKGDLVWFKNWSSLKSIHALEHFHVMIYDADREFLQRITNGDVPMSARV